MAHRLITLLSISAAVLISGCASINTNPNILAQPPYNKVTYSPKIKPGIVPRRSIEVTTVGLTANVLNTIPELYKKAIEEQTRGIASLDPKAPRFNGVYISNIALASYTKREPFQVPYQDCKTEYYTETVGQQSCSSGYGGAYTCQTNYVPQTRSRQNCTTVYRTEIRDVLYQKATADLYY